MVKHAHYCRTMRARGARLSRRQKNRPVNRAVSMLTVLKLTLKDDHPSETATKQQDSVRFLQLVLQRSLELGRLAF